MPHSWMDLAVMTLPIFGPSSNYADPEEAVNDKPNVSDNTSLLDEMLLSM